MKRVLLLLLAMTLLPVLAHAGTTTFNGSGSAVAPAEFITVQFSVKSECYTTSAEARKANDAVVLAIQEYLKSKINPSNGIDKIICNGGYATKYERTIYDGQHSKTVCRNTFQKTTDITFKTANVEGFDAMFAEMQDIVLAEYSRGDEFSMEAMSYAEMGTPSADICEHTRASLRDQAIVNATKDAQRKFRSFAMCSGIDLSESLIVAGGEERAKVSYHKSRYMESAPMSDVPVVETNFDNISVSADVWVEFEHPETLFSNCALMTGDSPLSSK